MKPEHARDVLDLALALPPGLRAVSPLVRRPADGRAFQEVVATLPGEWEIVALVEGRPVATKSIVSGERASRRMQPERVSGFWSSWLWPAEATLPVESPVARISFPYPDRRLAFLPEGPGGVILTFFLASVVFGLLVLKPLHVQI
jgi:hypothetical protein